MGEECNNIPILDKTKDAKRQAVRCIGSSILWFIMHFTALMALMASPVQIWTIIILDMGVIWGPWVAWAFGLRKTLEVKQHE